MSSTESRSARSKRRRLSAVVARYLFAACGIMAIVVLGGIFLILLKNAILAFTGAGEVGVLTEADRAVLTPAEIAEIESEAPKIPGVWEVVSGSRWMPDAMGEASYGILSLVVSTLLTTLGAMLIAVPIGLGTAGWLTFRARGLLREVVKFSLEMLAAIPSVVVGFLGIVVVGPVIASVCGIGSGLTALNGSILLALMALPTIISISEDALRSVPEDIIRGSLALGADAWETFIHTAVPAARSGLSAAVLLGMGRAIGETMTVLMATGNAIAMPSSFLDAVRTMTATIAIELGEATQGSTHYYMLFMVGFVLFLITLLINLAADAVQRRGEF